MCTVIDLEHQSLAVERPTTRRRPFAMNIDESGNELLLSESSAPESGSMAKRQGDHERPKIPISRPRSAPPADKMAAPDGACLRSQSAARDHAIAQLHTLPPRCMPPSAQHKKHPVVDLAQQCAVTAPHRNFCSCHASIGLHQRPRTHQISECASLSLRLSTYPSPVPT